MHEQIAREIRDMVVAAGRTEIPAEVRMVGQEGLAKAREACAKLNATVDKGARELDDLVLAAQANAKAIAGKITVDAFANANAALDAAQQVVEAKTVPEAAQLQAKYIQTQVNVLADQGKALLELSFKVAREGTEAWIAAARKVGDLSKATP